MVKAITLFIDYFYHSHPVPVEVADDVPEDSNEVATEKDENNKFEGPESENYQKLFVNFDEIIVVKVILDHNNPSIYFIYHLQPLLLIIQKNHFLKLTRVK